MLLDTAVILTGHEKIVTLAYNEENQLMPNDLALLDSDELIEKLEVEYPEFFWTPRITFAGLLDVPDKNGETKTQGPVIAMGIDFFSKESRQVEIWELEKNIVQGTLPTLQNEAIISSKLANQLNVFDILNSNQIVIGKTAIEKIQEVYGSWQKNSIPV